MYVIALRQDAVLRKAGSYVITPKSSSDTLISRKAIARTVPSSIGTSYCLPVRLSVTERVSRLVATSPSPVWALVLVSALIRLLFARPRVSLYPDYPELPHLGR